MTTTIEDRFNGYTDKARDEAQVALVALESLHALLQAIDQSPEHSPLPEEKFDALYAAVVDLRSATRGWVKHL